MKRFILPMLLAAAVLIPASAASAGGRWDRGSSSGNRGYNYDRGERYSGGGGGHSYHGGGYYGGGYYRGGHGYYGYPKSSFSLGFSFGNYGRYGDYYGGYYGRYGGYYCPPPATVYYDTYYAPAPPVRVYAPPPPPVVYYPSPRVYYYDGCSTGSSFSIGGSYYYRR